MTAWHGDPELKARIVARMHQHRKDDAFVQGAYQYLDGALPLGYRGCAIGCLLDPQRGDKPRAEGYSTNAWHDEARRQFGIPTDVSDLIDTTFEDFATYDDNHARASDFAVAVIEAIPVGADLTGVSELFDAWYKRWPRPNTDDWDADDRAVEDAVSAKVIELVSAAPVAVSDVDGAGGGGQL